MNTAEIPTETENASGSNPVAPTTFNKADIDPLLLPKVEPPADSTTELHSSPQSSPILRSGPTVKRHKSNQAYATPWELIRACERRFCHPIVFDLAANEINAKAGEFFSVADNALAKSWDLVGGEGLGMCWLNPPFDDITPWAKKCAEEADKGARILLLTPASIGANWFRDHVHRRAYVLALNGRITFEGASDPYPKDCMISAFGFGAVGFDVWTWQQKAKA